MNNKLQKLLSDPNIIGIMFSVGQKYSRNIDVDQLESIKINTLWECIQKYDSEKGMKFTSYLYQRLNFAFKNELKKKRNKEIGIENIENSSSYIESSYIEIFDGLPVDVAKILEQKYMYNMTMTEIGKQNGYSRETARRKLHKAINFYKNKNQIGV